MFWSFRVMVGLGLLLHRALCARLLPRRPAPRGAEPHIPEVALWTLPLPWIAAELGWFVAEHGRQPWAIAGVLPTFLAVSPIPASSVAFSLAGFVIFYTVLAVIDVYLLKKYVKLGPGRARRLGDAAH